MVHTDLAFWPIKPMIKLISELLVTHEQKTSTFSFVDPLVNKCGI